MFAFFIHHDLLYPNSNQTQAESKITKIKPNFF